MNLRQKATTVAECYDQALHWARDKRLPANAARPQPTHCWPPENVRLLEGYCEWLRGGGTSESVIQRLYLPMAGHVLGLNLKPHARLDLEHDLARAWQYLQAKHLSAEWSNMCRCALNKFGSFLRQQRGAAEANLTPANVERYRAGLPAWLVTELERYQHVMQSHWRPARVAQQTLRFWSSYTRLWRWLCVHHDLTNLGVLKRRYVLDYVDQRLATGHAPSTVNNELRCFYTFLLFLQENDHPVPPPLLRLPSLKQPDALPKFLTDEQIGKLRDDLESRVVQPDPRLALRDACLDRAAFYLLWQAGMRVGEVEELRLEDLGLRARKLTVRQGKGQKDRIVYLTDTTVRALYAYLAVRGQGSSSHVFLYRHQPVKKDLLRARMKLAGERVGVKVHPHRLRHTCATQLLNAGCRITSIQKFLGHHKLNSTMIYARVHEQTVAEDYYTAMAQVEQRLELAPTEQVAEQPLNEHARTELLELVETLAQPQVSDEWRMDVVARMHQVLITDKVKISDPAPRISMAAYSQRPFP